MNVVKILLVLGLGYVALTQKVEKTRNMLLVVTGLLAFCMFSMEGFTLNAAAQVASTCEEKASTSVPADAQACSAAASSAEECNAVMTQADASVAACNFTPGTPEIADNEEVGPTHLPILFPSCTAGKRVKSTAPATIGDGLCEDAPTPTETLTWENICGENAECNASVGFMGGETVATDNSNKCAESLYGTWPHTCNCIGEGTWTPDTGSGNGCSAPSPS